MLLTFIQAFQNMLVHLNGLQNKYKSDLTLSVYTSFCAKCKAPSMLTSLFFTMFMILRIFSWLNWKKVDQMYLETVFSFGC